MDFILSIPSLPVWPILLALLKALALVVSLFSFFGIIYVVMKSMELDQAAQQQSQRPAASLPEPADLPGADEFPFYMPTETQKIARARWDEIQKSLESAGISEYKIAVIEADALVDYVLKTYGYPGETMGDRMRSITPMHLPSIDSLWIAHKIRNEISHNTAHGIDERQAKKALDTFKQVLEDLDAI